MPRNLTADRHILSITDNLAGETYDLPCRMPTNAERLAYINSLYVQKGNKRVPKKFIYPEQVALGKKLVLGLPERIFYDGDKPVSSDRNSPNYRDNWRDLFAAGAPDVCQRVQQVMMNAVSVPEAEEEAEDDTAETDGVEVAAKEEAPLPSSSSGS